MAHWLHYNLKHPIALAVLIALLPIILIHWSAQRRRKRGLPPPHVSRWQQVLWVLLLLGLCIVAVFAEPG